MMILNRESTYEAINAEEMISIYIVSERYLTVASIMASNKADGLNLNYRP